MESSYNWAEFTLRIDIKKDIKAVYDAWTTRRGIESWFLRTSEFSRNGNLLNADEHVQPGDQYKWLWYGYDDGAVERGEIIQANAKDFLEFTFVATSNPLMKVAVNILQEEGTTIVQLRQYDIGLDDKSKSSFYVGCTQGWTFYLANLKSILEGGIDMRNRNENLKRMLNS
ncbi:MAG: SRPBCC domain-containing protein [Agriterribacter sp.]